ncbi:galactose-1-phosphate uridylyltransferase [Echinicola pacifica]|uniref:Galactose-1-phosphate uridylyltransferase n=1 Tax=Echinicola pacifica TaxID=346377 RepID=A0A918PUN5_9BACT|nr:UDP-glucose--hexose-1-phosphate uridylyltransferase [Echinicola pacifica]GGZ22662.1 galactose-1-phosphate uridylyltransferase [Echinicola pacifica]
MSDFNFEDHSHRRYNPFTGEWLQVSPHRGKRPWQGQEEDASDAAKPAYDEKCYLCPTNTRINGEINPDYTGSFVFQNDFGALTADIPEGELSDGEFFKAKSERGLCKVICFSPRHDLTIPELDQEAITKVVALWKKEYEELGQRDFINYVQIFENKGAVMGCSNPHPHGQIWAQESVPVEPAKKQEKFSAYYQKYKRSMVVDYVLEELAKGERILFENDYFVGLVPFWAVWPFEAMIAPKVAIGSLSELDQKQMEALADAYRQLTVMYDNVFKVSFPYSAGLHQAPTDGQKHPEWDLHMVFYPPLLRSATVKKFMVGYEMLANPQRDITAESAVKILKSQDKVHYKKKGV